MAARGWPTILRTWVKSFMVGRTTQLRLGEYIGHRFECSGGLPQGSPVSQLLWLCYSSTLIEPADMPGNAMSISWVDDRTVCVAGATDNELTGGLAESSKPGRGLEP
ncbi:hypothetical protein BCV69DRAFT_253931 [Microstroma glucosiphilum]|uniref:Reverse transcriptase domain-containing protein n=1 Tax=Pseudomicrostroma glucosiphilum TaxID=1684307 RepID=A0A316TWV0_9BASI|nr:hypothetical protein BCV69DRAFT_253931 [Pseudomicrostroma glucosiphilum]PWN17680.1 hypothetical protein BCV69DRAFT_253931 [Pseudomicrostroma glucosiphilum]